VALAGCGSSSSTTSTTTGSSPATTPAATTTTAAPTGSSKLTLQAAASGALMFDQTTLTASAGTVTIDFENTSSTPHNLTIADSTGKVLGATPTFSGGSKTLMLTLAKGAYTYYCSVPGHEAAGMKGTLTVN
jgi:plastocyanin